MAIRIGDRANADAILANMRKAGVPESVIMEITGHSTREMFDRYNTVDEEDTRKAIRQLEVYFESYGRPGKQCKRRKSTEDRKSVKQRY